MEEGEDEYWIQSSSPGLPANKDEGRGSVESCWSLFSLAMATFRASSRLLIASYILVMSLGRPYNTLNQSTH